MFKTWGCVTIFTVIWTACSLSGKTKWLNSPCRKQVMYIFLGSGKGENISPAELVLNTGS